MGNTRKRGELRQILMEGILNAERLPLAGPAIKSIARKRAPTNPAWICYEVVGARLRAMLPLVVQDHAEQEPSRVEPAPTTTAQRRYCFAAAFISA